MKNILFPSSKYLSLKPKKSIDIYHSQNNNDYSIKKSIIRNTKKEDINSIDLSSAYENINAMLSNCLESIQAEDKANKTIVNPLYKGINNLLKKSRISSNIDARDKSISLSNSITLLKSSEENILSNLNKESKKKLGNSKIIKSKLKKSISVNYANSNLKSKLGSLLHKNTASLFSPKKNNNNRQKPNFNINENEFDSHLNKEKIFHKFDKLSAISKNESQISKISKISIKSPAVYQKGKNTSKTLIVSDDIIKKEKNGNKNYKRNSLKLRRESKISVGKQLDKLPKKKNRSRSILLPTNSFKNIFEKNIKRNSLLIEKKNSIDLTSTISDNLKILSLKEIGNNLKKTISGFDINKLKKELHDLENNEISEAIKNLPKKNNKESTKIYSNKENIKLSLTNNSEDNLNEEYEGNENRNEYQHKYRKLFISKKVYDSLDDEEIDDEEEINNIFLSPNCITVYLIDFLVLIASIYISFYLPFSIAHNFDKCAITYFTIESVIFYFIDLLYIVDLVSGFFRAYYDFDEYLIRNNLSICINYLSKWFFIDLIEAIPIFTISNLSKEKCKENSVYNLYNSGKYILVCSLFNLKILKLFKIFSENRALLKIVNVLNKTDFFYNWSGVFFTMFVALCTLNFCSLYFIFLGKNIYPGWIYQSNMQNNNFYDIYITSVYYLMTTLTTVGYGDISVISIHEKYYQIILLMVGTCAYSWIITFISNYIKNNNEKYIDYEKKLAILGEIRIKYPNLKNDLYERILRYLNYNKSEYKLNLENILDSLPQSLQNNLIIEMYKPIIKNFYFFKSFENSDFFVKIVTSLKPILCMKNDILIQEGDFIEEIIFIKNGVLTLEILIDLNSIKDSAEAHLNFSGIQSLNVLNQKTRTERGSRDTIGYSYSLMSQNTNFNKFNSKFYTIEKKETKFENSNLNSSLSNNYKEIKIIDLRKNEHFGDLLMILNEKSPLTIKVASKKAELFFLQKTEATEISNQYPNIWKRIVKKSLYNMKEIKNIIRRKVFIFCELNDIDINPELKMKYLDANELNEFEKEKLLKNKKKNEHKKKKQIETVIVEEDENFDSMKNTYEIKGQNLLKNNKSIFFQSSFSPKQLSKIKSDEKNNLSPQSLSTNNKKDEEHFIKNINSENKLNIMELSSCFKSSKTSDIKEETKNNNGKDYVQIDNGNDIKSLDKDNTIYNINNMMSIIDEKMKENKGQINNLSINIFTPKAVQIPINQINNITHIYEKEKENKKDEKKEDDTDRNKINEEIRINEDFKICSPNNYILMNNYDKNNDIIYPPNLKKLIGKDNKKNKDYSNNLKILLGNNQNFNNIDKKDDDLIKNKLNNERLNKASKFFNLNNSKTISFTIESMYENLNQLSKYKFQTNSLLRLKTKKFILSQLFSKQKSLELFNIKTKKNSVNFSPHHNNLNKMGSLQFKNQYNSTISNDKDSISKSKEKNLKLKRNYSIDYSNKPIFNPKDKTNEQNKIKKNKRKSSYLFMNKLNKIGTNSLKITNISEKENFYKNTGLKKSSIHNTISEIDDESLHSRHKTYRKGARNKDKYENIFSSSIPKKLDIEEQISKNIEKNKQNLNNPEEYFCGFFNNILLQKKKTMRNSRMNKEQKRNLNYFFKNKEDNNNITSFKNNPENEITPIIRRNSTVKNEVPIKKVFEP